MVFYENSKNRPKTLSSFPHFNGPFCIKREGRRMKTQSFNRKMKRRASWFLPSKRQKGRVPKVKIGWRESTAKTQKSEKCRSQQQRDSPKMAHFTTDSRNLDTSEVPTNDIFHEKLYIFVPQEGHNYSRVCAPKSGKHVKTFKTPRKRDSVSSSTRQDNLY